MTVFGRIATGVFWLSVAAAPVLAFQPAPAQGDFVPVSALPPAEQLPAAPLLIAAYALVWVILLGYVWSIWRRLGRVERELHALGRRVEERSGSR
jgi:CcmD family protein